MKKAKNAADTAAVAANILFGIHAVSARLEQAPESIQSLYIQESRLDQRMQKLVHSANQQHVAIHQLTREEFQRFATQYANNQVHQGVIAFVETVSVTTYNESDLIPLLAAVETPPLLLVLDGVQDPHNLGACLRSANAAGAQAVIAPKDRAASLTPAARKVASGAAENTPFIAVTNLARTLRDLKEAGVWIYGMAGEAEKTLYEVDFSFPTAFVLGAEGEGLRRLTREHCDELLRVPMTGTVSSLNVSVATGICLFEVVRQRWARNQVTKKGFRFNL